MKKRFLFFLVGLFSFNALGAPERTAIKLPPMIRDQFLANMRDHLMAISEIQAALAKGEFERASEIAGGRLGLKAPSSAACRMNKSQHTSMDNSALSKYMPKEMHRIGFAMHTAADNFAADAKKAAPIRDYRMTIESLSNVTMQCVACHAKFRLAGR